MKRKLWGFGLLVSILIGGLVLQLGGMRDLKRGDTNSIVKPIGLAERVPLSIHGWAGFDESLGATEFLQSSVEKNLNYDDMVNRRYTKGTTVLGVYVGYWTPGRMPVQKVASHTPDRCWSENGWTCLADRFPYEVPTGQAVLFPAYWREFTAPGSQKPTYVLYWHLVGGEPYDYGGGFNQSLSPVAWWKETLHYAFKGSAEQYFIRLTSNKPFEELWDDPGVQEIVAALAELGLADENAAPQS